MNPYVVVSKETEWLHSRRDRIISFLLFAKDFFSLFPNCMVDEFLVGTVIAYFFHHKTLQKKFFKKIIHYFLFKSIFISSTAV